MARWVRHQALADTQDRHAPPHAAPARHLPQAKTISLLRSARGDVTNPLDTATNDNRRPQRKRNTLPIMKSAVIPQVRVEPALRAELEAVLQPGETLSGFVEASVRNAVAFRRVQTRFHERGQAAWDHYQSTGVSASTDEVLAKLQAKLDAKRKQLGG